MLFLKLTFVLPYFNYGIEMWDTNKKTHLDRLSKLHGCNTYYNQGEGGEKSQNGEGGRRKI